MNSKKTEGNFRKFSLKRLCVLSLTLSVITVTFTPLTGMKSMSNVILVRNDISGVRGAEDPWWDPDGVGVGEDWHYRIEYNISKPIGHASANYSSSPIRIDIDFSTFASGSDDIDENSIRVAKKDGTTEIPSESQFWKNDTDPTTTGYDKCRVLFLVPSTDLKDNSELSITYYIYYDTIANPKASETYPTRMGYDPRFAEHFTSDRELTCGTHALFSAVDWNDDGDRDIVTGCNDGNILYFENENNTFTYFRLLKNSSSVIDVGAISTAFAVDYDGDGDEDIISGEHFGGIYYYECIDDITPDDNSDGIFEDAVALKLIDDSTIDVGTNVVPCVIDFSRPTDGYLDLVVGEYDTGKVRYYENAADGSGKFNDRGWLQTDSIDIDVGTFAAPFVTDYDSDDELDLLIGARDGNIYYYKNKADGNPPSFSYEGKLQESGVGDINVGYASYPYRVDWDGDGDEDLIIGNGYGNFSYFNKDDVGTAYTFKGALQGSPSFIDVGNYAKPCAADWTKTASGFCDGDLDLIVGNGEGYIYYYENNGNDTFTSGERLQQGGSDIYVAGHAAPYVVDLNMDNRPDIVVGVGGGIYDGRILYYERNEDGTLATGVYLKYGSGGGAYIDVGSRAAPCVEKWNDDDLDLIIGNTDGRIYYFEKNDVKDYYDPQGPLKISGIDIDVGYTSAPNVVDWSGDAGLKDVIAGAWGESWTTPDDIHYYERNNADGTLSDGGKMEEDGEILYVADTTPFPAPFAVKWNDDDHYDLIVGDHDGFVRYYPNNGYPSHNVTDLTHQLDVELLSQEEYGGDISVDAPTNIDTVLEGTSLEDVNITWTLSKDDGAGENDVIDYDIYYNQTYTEEDFNKSKTYTKIGTVSAGMSYFVHDNDGLNTTDSFYYVVVKDGNGNTDVTVDQAGKIVRECVLGWNFISDPYLGLDSTDITTVLSSLEWDSVRWYNPLNIEDHWVSYSIIKPSGFNDFTEMNRTMGIWVNVTIGGDHFIDTGRVHKCTSIQLYKGWNLVSYASFINRTVEDALSDIWSNVEQVEAFVEGNAPYYLKTLSGSDWMEAGCGYWIRVSDDCVWTM